MTVSGWTAGVFICCLIVALLLLRHVDLLTFTPFLEDVLPVTVAKSLFSVEISIFDALMSTNINNNGAAKDRR